MADEKWVDNHHYRIVSEDGTRSWLYYTETGWDKECIEVTDHTSDGESYSYEAPGFWDMLFSGGRGTPK